MKSSYVRTTPTNYKIKIMPLHWKLFLSFFPTLYLCQEALGDAEINYKEIKDHFGMNYPIKNLPPNWQSFIAQKFRSITPFLPQNSDPETTLLPFFHIPKTGGEGWWAFLKKQSRLATFHELNSYQNSFWPRMDFNHTQGTYKSLSSPGCKGGTPAGTHCDFGEIRKCLENNWANFYLKSAEADKYFTQDTNAWDRDESLRPKEWIKMGDKSFSDFNTVKYTTLIRHPIIRVLSES